MEQAKLTLENIIAALEAACVDPRVGLPEPVFLLISRLVPMVNVDLLIKDEAGRTLLTWREDVHYGRGWHIPGGIIRLKETAAHRVQQVAKLELGCAVTADDTPLTISECIAPQQINRGHCISLLYRCRLASPLSDELRYIDGKPRPGMYKFFERTPGDLLPVHEMYRKYF